MIGLIKVVGEYCSNPNAFPTSSSSFIVQNNISRKLESNMSMAKVASSMSVVKVESNMVVEKVESGMVKSKAASAMSEFNSSRSQKLKTEDDEILIKSSEKRKSERFADKELFKGPDEKKRLIG